MALVKSYLEQLLYCWESEVEYIDAFLEMLVFLVTLIAMVLVLFGVIKIGITLYGSMNKRLRNSLILSAVLFLIMDISKLIM